MIFVINQDNFARARFFLRVCALIILSTLSGCKGATLAFDFDITLDGRKPTLLAMCVKPLPAWILSSSSGKLKISLTYPLERYPIAPPNGDLSLPCGKCAGCKKDSSDRWIVRMMCELLVNRSSSFVTLTYNDLCLPPDNKPAKLDLQRFFKRLRQSPRDYGAKFDDLRYFCVSEHGKNGTFRLHYHALIFGIDFFNSPWSAYVHHLQPDGHPLYTSDLLAKVWGKGFVSVDIATPATASYIGKYLVKSRDDDEIRLFSQRLGLKLFCNFSGSKPISLNSTGVQTFSNGFLVLPSGSSFRKVAAPKFLDRYAESFSPDLLELHKSRKRDFVSNFCRRGFELVDYGDFVNVQTGKLKERKLHG